MDNKKIICSHCRKIYNSDFSYCPYCAEPKPIPRVEKTPEQIVKEQTNRSLPVALIMMIMWYIPCVLIVYGFNIFFAIIEILGENEVTIPLLSFKTALLISLVVDFVMGIIIFIVEYFKTPREKIISYQFSKDQTSICPLCGSHSISLGRKGYNWNRGFWYRMFNIKGGHYLAGMDSRQVTAHCNNCGHRWKTDKEWIK